ncbi:MAG: DUF5659 domain-containing protein [Desulfobacterales bacterium]
MKKTNTSDLLQTFLYIYDINVSAYLEYKGLTPELKKEGTRVIFCFPNSPETQILMIEYYNNPSVKLVDFISHLRRLRAQMLSLRG